MARQNIQFKGIRHSPSDITGQDGDLLECVNLIHENGELKPIEMPEQNGISLNSGYTLAAVHNVVGDKIFVSTIVSSGNTSIQAVKETTGTPPYESVNIGSTATKTLSGEVVKWVETVGNTLIVGTDKSTHYALFKNGTYKWLGDKLPQPIFEFDFRRSANTDDGYYISEFEPNTFALFPDDTTINGGGIPLDFTYSQDDNEVYIPSKTTATPQAGHLTGPNYPMALANNGDENRKIFRDSIRSRVEKALGTARKNNVFVFPFYVRYAVRMFDNSYVMHSAPVLMLPATWENPLLGLLKLDNVRGESYEQGGVSLLLSKGFDSIEFRAMEMTLKFTGWVDENGNTAPISDWEDIVKGADIFLSSQISSYDEGGWDDLNNVQTRFYPFGRVDVSEKDFGYCYSQNKKIAWYDIFNKDGSNNPNGFFNEDDYIAYTLSGGSTVNVFKNYRIELPSYSEELMMKKIKNVNLFYRVKEYDVSDLDVLDWGSPRYFRDEVERATLDRLESLPTLPDDYVSRCRMVGGTSYDYNQRLILGNLQLQAPLWYQDAKTFPTDTDKYGANLTFIIEKPEKTFRVEWQGEDLGQYDFGHYIYYPDPDCREVLIQIGTSVTKKVTMQAHTGLNGAFALMPDLKSYYEESSNYPTVTVTLPTSDRYYSLQNTIAMSKVANPFYFDASNFKDLGRTKVIGIATNTLDVSYEQWGPYPIIVFCNDGIVAVTIDREGNFTGGVDAISADVLREPQGMSQPTLVQTGQALMFLTQRGVMMIAGTKISCVSEAMNGRNFNPLSDLLPAGTSPSVLYNVGAFSDIITKTSDNSDFKTLAKTGFLAYDYAHNRLLLLNVNKDYQYVFSLNTGLWSKQISYTNLGSIQVSSVPAQSDRSTPTLTVVPMKAAVNNYTEMYLQDTGGHLYKTMDVTSENVTNSLYQYGYFISRPVRFGTDEYKTITRMLNRHTHYAANSFVKTALYGSRDGVRYGRVNTLRGMSYQYYIFVVYTYLKPNERYSYLSVDFEPRLLNKLR